MYRPIAFVDVMAFKSAGRMKIEIPISQMKEDNLEEDLRNPDIRLTSFVRASYLEHLTKRLFENVQSCASEELSSSCKADVKRYAIQMEHKALRQCMVVGLYQRAITSMLADIKHSTEHSQLHSNLQAFVPPSCEKSTQTEAATLAASQIYNSSRLTPSDSLVPRSEALLKENLPRVATHLADIMEYDSSGDYCERSKNKILPLCPRSLPPEPAVTVNEQLTGVTITKTCAKKSVTGTSPKLCKPVDTYSQVEASIVDFQQPHRNPQFDSVSEKKPKKIEAKKRVLCEPKCSPSRTEIDANFESTMLTLDQRVAAIHGEYYNLDGSTDDKSKRKTKKKIIWQYEKLHRYKILNARLTALGKLRRLKVEHQFLVLFGKDVPVGISHGCEEKAAVDDPLVSYKERIAPWVVKYLMPHYSSGKIKSRPLFKYTAKYITDNLIDTNHLPDEGDVRNSVDLLFTN